MPIIHQLKDIKLIQNIKISKVSLSKHTWFEKNTQYEVCEHTSSYGLIPATEDPAPFATFP